MSSSNKNEKPSARELEVLKHMANGLERKDIAKAMFISEATVHHHEINVCAKLDAKNGKHAVYIYATQYLEK